MILIGRVAASRNTNMEWNMAAATNATCYFRHTPVQRTMRARPEVALRLPDREELHVVAARQKQQPRKDPTAAAARQAARDIWRFDGSAGVQRARRSTPRRAILSGLSFCVETVK